MFVSAADVAFETYDVIIVGSGPAGVTVARRLESLGKRSLVIETGPLEYDSDLHDAYSALYASGHYDRNYWPNHWVRSFGGTSLVWAGWCAPLTDRNLAAWPVNAADLAPYYVSAAGVLGRSVDFLTYSAPFITGFDSRPFSVGETLRVAAEYPEYFQNSGSVDVLLETNVTELFANEAGNRVTELRIFNSAIGHRDISLTDRQQLVLAAGGLGNAQILLSSRSRGDVAIGNERDQVGRYLMEHPHLHNCARMVVAADLMPSTLPSSFGEARHAIVPDDALHARNGGLDASLGISETKLDSEDNVEQYIIGMLGGNARGYDITIRCEMPPDPENRVQLAEGTDPSGMPRLRATCVIAGEALRAAENYLRSIGMTLVQEGKGRLRIDNEVIYREVTGGGHIIGTTRMGDDPATSVVDRNCRVHGYINLSIAGSSVFTTGGYANPTLTIIALALRLADHLGET
jgi:choline dehydrogenase-like flavoprotein